MNCPRCGKIMSEPEEGWAKCPGCGLSKPVIKPDVPEEPKIEENQEAERVYSEAHQEAERVYSEAQNEPAGPKE